MEEENAPSSAAPDAADQPAPKFRRIILKLSGEALKGEASGEIIDPDLLLETCKELQAVHAMGVEIGVVIGGGNIFRGLAGHEHRGVARMVGDNMGMLASVINGLALMDGLEQLGVEVRVQTAIPMEKVAEPFIPRRAVRHLEKGRIVVFVAGTGNPFFTTDTTAALRGSEISADVLMKATKVDGVYDKDPAQYPDAKRYDRLTFVDALRQRLKIMDATAFSLCMENNLPILVYRMTEPGSIRRAVRGEEIGTLVHS